MFPEDFPAMPNATTSHRRRAIAEFLEHCGVKAAFGVISIHNMPILDAMFDAARSAL
jgi:acetolactate synthase-1/2/3 large subunit